MNVPGGTSRNGIFVAEDDLTRPAAEVVPIATICGTSCHPGGGPVNPVDWKVFAEHGLPLRGPTPDALGLDPQNERLRAWNLDNLDSYWRPWARSLRSPWLHLARSGYSAIWTLAYGVLGAPRLHCTIATGEVVSKEVAGTYALEVFAGRWHPLVHNALSYREGRATRLSVHEIGTMLDETAAFVDVVADSAHDLVATAPLT